MSSTEPTALLGALAEVHGIDVAADLAEVMLRLEAPIARYTELELRSEGTRVDLVTLQEQCLSAKAFLSCLEDRGAAAEELAHISALARFGAGSTLGMKLPVAGPLAGGEAYVRAAIPVAEASSWLALRGVDTEGLDTLASLVGKDYLHMLAADAATEPRFTAFFTRHIETGTETADSEVVHRALGLMGVEDSAVETTVALHRMLSASVRPGTLYLSFEWGQNGPTGRAKLDYPGLRAGLLAEAAAACGHDPDLPLRWAKALGRTNASYAGLAIGRGGPASLRAYYTIQTTLGM